MWLLLAVLFLVLAQFPSQVVRFRIRFARWINWNWAADLLEDHFEAWVRFFRVLLLIIAAVFLIVAWREWYA